MNNTVDAILKRLEMPGAHVLDLLQAHQVEEDRELWRQDSRLYRAFARKLISAGHPTRGRRAGVGHTFGNRASAGCVRPWRVTE